jgi:hypothetical protein
MITRARSAGVHCRFTPEGNEDRIGTFSNVCDDINRTHEELMS